MTQETSQEQERPRGAESGAESSAESIVRLRGDLPRVMRLSRKAIGIAFALASALIGAALLYALQPQSRPEKEELYNTQGITLADNLASAPKDYSQVPKLGPALPGDLGKPILEAQDRGALAQLPPIGAPSAQARSPQDDAHERARQERETARTSQLFVGGGAPAASQVQAPGDLPAGPDPQARPDGAASHTPLLSRPADLRTAAQQRLEGSPSTHILQAGSIIPAALITGIRSDQPGLVTAQVTENVYDNVTGRLLLIPQGSRLIGDYESDIGFGQRRVLLSWNRLILPDGGSIVLERQPAADPSGYAGLEDGVDFHWGGVFRAALVSTLLGIGGELESASDGDLARAFRRGGQDSINRTGEQIVSRELNIRPTLTIRPGFPVRVLVTRDIVMGDGA